MYDNLIIFQQDKYLFGLYPEDFEQHISLDQMDILPSDFSESVWKFQSSNHTDGLFVHLGLLFDQSLVPFSYEGYIFFKELDSIHFGVLMENYVNQISTRERGTKKVGLDVIKKLPPQVPKNAFRYVYLYKKKKIIVIDPLMLFRSYKNLFPANV